MSQKTPWLNKMRAAGHVFPSRPKGTPKKEWQRLCRERYEQAARKRGAAHRAAEARKAGAEQEEREQVEQPPREQKPELDQEARRAIVRNASPAEFQRLLSSYGVAASAADEQRLNPTQQGSAEALLEERGNAAAAARKKRQEELPKFDARTATREEIIARMKLRGLTDPSLHMGIREATKPLDPSSVGKGEKVFDQSRFRRVMEANVDQSIRANLALNARQAVDAAKVAEASRKVTLPAPRPEREGVAPGLWPLVPH